MDTDHPAGEPPCFVHSHLDKGSSLRDWLSRKESDELRSNNVKASAGVPHSRSSNDKDDLRSNYTKALAETAVGVREMSKQLGRARVRSGIDRVLVVTKARDNGLVLVTRKLALYLMQKLRNGRGRGLIVYVDHQLKHSKRFNAIGIQRNYPELFEPIHRKSSSFLPSSSLQDSYDELQMGQLRYWTKDLCSRNHELFDLVITVGGDTVLSHVSWLFQRIVPPVLPLAVGSLGFLANFEFANYQTVVDSTLDAGMRVNLRMRFTCTIYRAWTEKGERKRAKKDYTSKAMERTLETGDWDVCESGLSSQHEILNELVIDRGSSPNVSHLEVFGDGHHITTVQADGLYVATPTGSNAYSLSSGGSHVHPEIPAILISPIYPHDFWRPMLLPDSMEVRIFVSSPYNSRSSVRVSFDNHVQAELKPGNHLKISASRYPFPTVCVDSQSTDWFHSIARTLKMDDHMPSVVDKRPMRKDTTAPAKGATKQDFKDSEETSESSDEDGDVDNSGGEYDIEEHVVDVLQEAAIETSKSRVVESRSSNKSARVPTLPQLMPRRPMRQFLQSKPRAFAVWGHDETDSESDTPAFQAKSK